VVRIDLVAGRSTTSLIARTRDKQD